MNRTLLVLGTRNRKKIEELRPLLDGLPIDLALAADFPSVPEIIEDGDSFEANAQKKAVGVARACGKWTLAEDSGLVVPALAGEPGVHSAHYAGTHGDDQANNEKLLRRLAEAPAAGRDAYYICVAVLASPQGEVVAQSEGLCHGSILSSPRGVAGFGYDPLFFFPEFNATFAEIPAADKATVSHRAKAIQLMLPHLRQHLVVLS